MVLGSLSFTAGAADNDTADTAAQADVAEEAADTDTAVTGATADEIAPTGWSLLSEAQFQTKLSAMRSKYPDGSIWEGVYYEGGYAKATTCWAYAAQMLKEIFGVNFYADGMLNYKYYDASGVTAGDWVRIDWDSHSIFITKVTSSGVWYTDGNGTGVYNQVRWDGFYSWSDFNSRFSYRLHLPGNTLKGEEVKHTIAYAGNGGSGSIASQSVESNKTFTLQSNGFSRSGYSFAGYIVKRSYDNTWYTTNAGWQTQDEIYNNGYRYKIYPQGNTYTLGSPWIGGITSSTTFTFTAQWLPDQSTLEFAANYSGYNYILGSDLAEGYNSYIFSRDSSAYTVSVDSSEKLNGANSLKITGTKSGSAGSDLAFITSTNKGYGNGYSTAGTVGDDKTFTLHFYAKASVDGAKMYLRWGYTSAYVTVNLSKSWTTYSVQLPKNRYCGNAIHPYFDKAGTYYLNSLSLGDISWTSNVTPETAVWAAESEKITRGSAPGSLPTPTREGYAFEGWFTAAEGGEQITDKTVIDASTIRLYAHWRKDVSYTPVKTVIENGHKYELYDNTLAWEDAARFCLYGRGGHLVTLTDADENETVYKMIEGRQGYCWIGLHCADQKTDWQWVDDTELSSYKKWYNSSYGTHDSGEYYGFMYPINYGTTPYASTWDKCVGSEYFCSYYGYHNSFFVCEYDMLCGDTDGSGAIDTVDATLIQRKCSGLKTNIDDSLWKRGDVNSDDVTDIIDVTYIQRYLANLITLDRIGDWKTS